MASSRGPVSARRIARLCCGGLLLAGLAGACRLDDRTLTGSKLASAMSVDSGKQCPDSGEGACETCLYQQCCDELQACGPGSPCARYLGCATDCDSDQACLNACALDAPAGISPAVTLGVCAGGRCTSCSGQTAPTSCNPGGGGACQSSADCDALEAGALERLDLSVCSACDQSLVSVACERCLSGQTGLSPGCSSCFAEWLECGAENCLLICQGNNDPSACELCMSDAGCTGQLSSCGFSG